MKIPTSVGVPLIVIVFDAQFAVTPIGNPVGVPIPVAVVVVCVIFVKNEFTHIIGDDEAAVTVLRAVTVIVPVADRLPQPPVNEIL